MDTARYARFERPGHAVTGDRSQRSRNWMSRGDEGRLRLRPRDRRRPLPPRLCRALHRRARQDGHGLRRAGAFVVRGQRHRCRKAHDGQRLLLRAKPLTEGRARRSAASSTSRPSPTGHARTGKSSASTRRWEGSGPTGWPTAHTAIATAPCHTGCATTTSADPTAQSEAGHRSAAFTTCVGRTPS